MIISIFLSLLLGLAVLWISFQMKSRNATIAFAVLAGANFGMNFLNILRLIGFSGH